MCVCVCSSVFEFSLGWTEYVSSVSLYWLVILHKPHINSVTVSVTELSDTTEFMCVLIYYPQNTGDSIAIIHILVHL